MKLYGIPNCNTVKTARTWLESHQQAYEFHDFKKQGVPEVNLKQWLETLGWETVVNKRGTTWRKLDAATQAQVIDNASALPVLLANPSLIKRPVLETETVLLAGFNESQYESLLK